ncbi:MAG TPA: chitobiase/beta-hexosaminidase C-terminal domain-containing protein [Opitutaceae bacterium]|jgi:hypothetical protein|nr:chitobiase/beta-hexosaminidase C-terminal domain-containing protein [Opitutaceae bacterium]
MNTSCHVSSHHVAARWLNARAAFCTGLIVLSTLALLPSAHAVDVLTDMNDNGRTGRNPNETTLNTGNVNQATFGKVWSYTVNGSTYAQPLYASSISIAGGTHNVVFIETMNDDAYAFDADSNTQLWHVSFIGGNITAVPIADITGSNSLNIVGNVGIEGTPVIDKSTGTIYMLARTKNTSNTTYIQTLHALDLSTGAEKFGGPVVVTTSGFNSKMQNQRMGLALANGNIIIAWTSHEDKTPYRGWMMAYNATTLAQTGVFNDTATGTQGGIWQQGRAPAVDASGNVYVITGNGTWDGTKNFGESFLKLSSTLGLLDWFTPDNFASLNSGDEDLGASGAMLIPGTSIVMGGGKQGTTYLCNTNSMGHEQSGNGQIIQHFTFGSGQLRGGPVYYVSPVRGPVVYDMASGDHLKEYTFNGSTFATTAAAQSTATSPGLPGGFVSISDNNGSAGSGIVWATIGTANNDHGNVSGLIRAWDADNIGGTELWDSNQNTTRDALGTFVKDAHPTIANGRVYVGSYSNRVNVYGLLGISPVAAPSFSPGGGTFGIGTAVNVTITSATSGANIRYTTDGSTPSETAGTIYSGSPVAISTHTVLQAIAYKSGMTDSTVTSATYDFEGPQAASPTFSPPAGTYATGQNVAISTITLGATIRYTTDGSTPSETVGTIYAGTPVNISATATLRAIAYETGFTDSPITAGTYTIGSGPITLEAENMSPVGTGATVSISNDANASGGVVEFLNATAAGQTMTLTTPSISGGTYQVQFRYKSNTTRGQHTIKIDGIQVDGTIDQYAATSTYKTVTLGSIMLGSGTHTIVLAVTGKNSAATQFYITADSFTLTPQAEGLAAPAFSPPGGTYGTTQLVAISSTSGASIRYTTDGSTPSETAGTLYSGPVNISTTTTLKAIAFESGFADTPVTSATYLIGEPPFNFESESLSPVGSGATVSISNDANASAGVIEFLNSTAAGQTMTFTTPNMPAGTYQLQMRYKTNTTRGQHTLTVDGIQVGGTLDQYATTSAYLTATLGTVTLTTSGAHTIVMTVTGKNSAATQFYITSDKFTFIPQ